MGTDHCVIILMSLLMIYVIRNLLFNGTITKKTSNELPPQGPPTIPIIYNFRLLLKPLSELDPVFQSLRAKYGPIFALRFGSKRMIFVASHSLSHEALIAKGAIFADRPPAFATAKFLSCNQHNISSGFYGPTWLLLRRNLTSNILQSSRMKLYACTRKRVLEILINRLRSLCNTSSGKVEVMEHFQYAIFCLLASMCFGDKLEEKQIKDIEHVQRRLLLSFDKFNLINLFPESLGRVLFSKRWEELFQLRQDQENVLLPLIRVRRVGKEENIKIEDDDKFLSYVDTLFDLELPEEKRKLDEKEITTLCSEFLSAGTDTTSTALQWIMANLVKYPHTQEKLFMEMKRVVGDEEGEIKEQELQKMPYLKAVILEGLRRHPPGSFLIPHAVKRDVVLNGFLVPKKSTVIFMVADMGRDPKVWENPMEFKPERFLRNTVETLDITGSREIKMMPFGVGRRMCPAYSMAMLHLEYLVANLVWCFEWNAPEGEEVNLSEKREFTTVMKNPLQVRISPRIPLHV